MYCVVVLSMPTIYYSNNSIYSFLYSILIVSLGMAGIAEKGFNSSLLLASISVSSLVFLLYMYVIAIFQATNSYFLSSLFKYVAL